MFLFFRANSENGEVRLDHAGVYGLHMRPCRSAPGATQKSRKKQALQTKTRFFLDFVCRFCGFWCQNGVQLADLVSAVSALGAPGGAFGVQTSFLVWFWRRLGCLGGRKLMKNVRSGGPADCAKRLNRK